MNTLTVNNKKGLTLIELLGVIVILGIIAAIAFPAINSVINNSRKDAFASNVNSFIEAAETDAISRNLVEEKTEFVYEYDTENNEWTLEADDNIVTDFDGLVFTNDTGIQAGKITITIDDKGVSTITIETPFANDRFETKITDVKTSEGTKKILDRTHVQPKGTTTP